MPGTWGISFLAVPSLLGGWGTENKTPRDPCHPLSLWASSCAPSYLDLGVHPTGWGNHRPALLPVAVRPSKGRKEGKAGPACKSRQDSRPPGPVLQGLGRRSVCVEYGWFLVHFLL